MMKAREETEVWKVIAKEIKRKENKRDWYTK